MMLCSKHSKMQKSQRGFTLVAVLILSGLASILVLSSIKDNVNQERLSGNFQKKINARLMSERGIFDAMAEAQAYLNNNSAASVSDLAANIADLSKVDDTGLSFGGMKYKVQLTAGNDELVLSSTGNRFEGESTLKVRLKIVPASGGSSGFSSAIVGCDSVDLSGSGQIDSYNSAEASYNPDSPGTEGNVTTINKDGADVTLGGYSPIYGDINATGNIDTRSSMVVGNLHANGDITLGENTNPVSGNVLARGNYFQGGGNVGGYVRVNGNAEMDWSTTISNDKNQGLDIQYGGNGIFKDNEQYEDDIYNFYPNVAKVKGSDETVSDPTDTATNCDYMNITGEIKKIDDGNNDLKNFTTIGWSTSYTMLPSKLYLDSGDGTAVISSVNANVFGTSTEVFRVSKFKISNDRVVIKGDVTLFVDGDFVMTGSPEINITEDSSLTLIVTGKVMVGGSAKITTDAQSLTPSGIAPFRIYSSYQGDDLGITLNGDGEMYAQIYAPLAKVDIAGSGTLYGAVRGKTVAVSGGAAIHYDAALGAANQGGNGTNQQSSLQFAGFEY